MKTLDALTTALIASFAVLLHVSEDEVQIDTPVTFSSKEQLGAFAIEVSSRVGFDFPGGYLDSLLPDEQPAPMEGEAPSPQALPQAVTIRELAQTLFDAQTA